MNSTETRIAEALRRAHDALLDDLRKLEEAVRPVSAERLAELRVQLGATHAHITAHFRFEEQNGYMNAVRKREPRLDRAIQLLAQEHRQLAEALNGLLKVCGAATSLEDTLRQQVRTWIQSVRQHEAREDDLVQEAFNLDIGAEG